MRRLKLDTPTLEVVESALGGLKPTQKRLLGLLAELAQRRAGTWKEDPVDEDDIEKGRTPYRAREHAVHLNRNTPENLDAALSSLTEAQQRHAIQGQERLADRIATNEASGLHRTAPVTEEDPPMTDTERPTPSPESAVSDPPTQDDADAAEIERRKAVGIRRTRDVAEGLERGVLQRMPTLRLHGRSLKTLEDAAEVLIAELQPIHQDSIRQVCQEHSMDAWVLILGAVARMADLQELHAGEFEEHWKNRQSAGGTAASAKVEVCQMCGGELPPDPVRRNRTACCSRHGSGQVQHTQPGESTSQPGGCPLRHRQMVKGAWVTVND